MSQAPAIPKKTRILQLLASQFLGQPLALSGRTIAETAALELCAHRKGEHWAPPACVTFLIPLVGPEMVSDWTTVERLLNNTLASFQRQSDQRWSAIICCQVKPNLPDDPRITYLPFQKETEGNDKWSKLATLYTHLGGTAAGSGVSMTFDADDVAHPKLVAKLLAAPSGSLITHGIVYDAQSDHLAQAKPQTVLHPRAKAFWKLCGSCAALPYDTNQPSFAHQIALLSAITQHEHRMVPYLARLAGHKLKKQRDSLVLYLLNHGENFGARRGRVSFKTKFANRFEITDDKQLKGLRSAFALSELTK